jgi:hypothetical protein
MWLFIGTSVVVVTILVLAGREVALFVRQRASYPLRRLTLRLAMAGMLVFLFGSIGIGVHYFRLDDPAGIITLWLAFWGSIGLLTAGILCLALADLRSLHDDTSDEAARLWQEMAETVARHEHTPPER